MLRQEEYKFDFGGEKLRVTFKPTEVGQVKTVEDTRDPLSSPYRPQLSQFMHAYAVFELKGHVSGILRLQLPPWETQVIVRLLTEREARGTVVPIKVDTSYLRLKGKGNQRWTLDGKPAIALAYGPSHNDRDAIRAELKRFQELLGDFILLAW
jgi:hypothetical protein